MENFHKLLRYQLEKYLKNREFDTNQINDFLKTISDTYYNYDRDKQITEHAFQVSELEYQEILKSLTNENEIKQSSIKKIQNAILMLDNNSDELLMEEDLLKTINFLEEKVNLVKEIEEQLIKAKDFAENASKAKSDFLSVMSHEIRTPLNAIVGNIHVLEAEEVLPHQHEYISTLKISANNLLNLINDVLDFNKIEDGKIVFEEKDLEIRTLVGNIKKSNRFKAEERGNQIKIMFDEDIPDFIIGDEVRLNQILNNLVSNSIKFTQNGKITIEVNLSRKLGEKIFIDFSIKDTGIGIKNEKISEIFERFTQANSNITRQYGGSGLGLTIIKKLLQLQNSDIFVESEEGKGSNFYFTMEFKASTKLEAEKPILNQSIKDLNATKILVVDDVEFNIRFIVKMLTNWNATVEIAENGLIAFEKALTEKFDLILMDIQMPVMDGLTATYKIREKGINTPIIALTASSSSDTYDDVFKAGMNSYVTKPFVPDDLYNKIISQLNV